LEPVCPVDLRELAAQNGYRSGWDESYDAKAKHRENLDPAYVVIPCRFGVVYPVGGDVLAAEVLYHPGAAKKLRAVPGVTPFTDGDDGVTFRFPAELFGQVAGVLRPRKRRRLSEGQRRACAERLDRVRPTGPAVPEVPFPEAKSRG
jgi:hypothetical protein